MTVKTLAEQQADGLRRLADMIEQNPELAARFAYTLNDSGITVHLEHGSDDKPAQLARIARTVLRHGGTVDKQIDDTWHNLVIGFHGIRMEVLAYREEVCERVQVGTETVTRKERDPQAVEAALAEVPEVEVTEEVPRYEWQCRPLLDI